MSTYATTSILGIISGTADYPSPTQWGPILETTPTPVVSSEPYVLVSGNNTIPIPAGASMVIIELPSTGNSFDVTFKGFTSGDVGWDIGQTGFMAIPVKGQTSMILSCAGNMTVPLAVRTQ